MQNILKRMVLIVLIIKSMLCLSQEKNNIEGDYFLKDGGKLYQALSDMNYEKITLNKDNTYVLYRSPVSFSPVIDQCSYASKGQWKKISDDIIDLNSEDNYLNQNGFKYELKKEKKFSNDSIYINIELHSNFDDVIPTPEFNIWLNSADKIIETTNRNIKISKKEYSLLSVKNQIKRFDLIFKPYGKTYYTNRLRYNILKNIPIDFEQYNYFTIKLPYFDQCFYEFESYNHNYIYIKNKSTLMWQGQEWIKEGNNKIKQKRIKNKE